MDLGKEGSGIYLHDNIRALRKKLQLSQEELASQVGLNRGNIASYEKGTAEPKICNLLKLSKLFKVSILDLTQRDLKEEDHFSIASNNYRDISNGERELITKFADRSKELARVIEGIQACHQFKTKNINEMPRDMQVMKANFEQLHDAAQTLMRNHQALLDFISCRMK